MRFNGEEIGYTTIKIEMLGNKLTVWNYLSKIYHNLRQYVKDIQSEIDCGAGV